LNIDKLKNVMLILKTSKSCGMPSLWLTTNTVTGKLLYGKKLTLINFLKKIKSFKVNLKIVKKSELSKDTLK